MVDIASISIQLLYCTLRRDGIKLKLNTGIDAIEYRSGNGTRRASESTGTPAQTARQARWQRSDRGDDDELRTETWTKSTVGKFKPISCLFPRRWISIDEFIVVCQREFNHQITEVAKKA